MVPDETDRPLRPVPGRVDHPGGIRVVTDKLAGDLERRPAWVDPRAALGEPLEQPVPLGVGLLGQPADVDPQALGAAHERGQAGRAQRGVRPGLRGRALQMGDEPPVRGPRGGGDLLIGIVGYARGEPADGRGPLTWSSAAMALSTASGQAARCASRAAARCSGGA